MNLTLDGVAPGKSGGGEVVSLSDEDSWKDLFATLETVDSMVIGGGSQEDYLGHWKAALNNRKSSASERKYAEIAMRTPHFVLSRTLQSVDAPNVTILPHGVDDLMDLKRRPGRDIIMWGGPTVAGAAIEAGLIDEYHLEVHPAIAGRGKKLFTDVSKARRLRQLDSKTFPSGITVTKYGNT
jgi:dihydrofolate reductase